MTSRQVHSLLTPGRVVHYLNPITGLTELAMVCGGPEHVEAASASRASRNLDYFLGAGGGGAAVAAVPAVPERKLYLLVLHSRSPMDEETPVVAQKAQNGEWRWVRESSTSMHSLLRDWEFPLPTEF
jgi:hypothetical protein